MRITGKPRGYFLPLILFFCASAMGATPPKEALLIANGKYSHFAGLAHPGPDSVKLAAALEGLGFHVKVVRDGSREQMLNAISEFERGLRNNGAIAFFHYGGHGVQVDGKNYLLPADADIPDERRVATRAVALDEVMTAMDAAAAQASIIVIDACRDNPLPAGSGRNLTRGLSVIGLKPKNSIIIYAAEAGSKAMDGLFTPILANSLQEKGKTIDQVMKKVRSEVYEKSSGQQTPGEYNQLFEELFLGDPIAETLVPETSLVEEPTPQYKTINKDQSLIQKNILNYLKTDFFPILDSSNFLTNGSQAMRVPFNFKWGDVFSSVEKSILDLSKSTKAKITAIDYYKDVKFLTVEDIPQKSLLRTVFIFKRNQLTSIELHYGNNLWNNDKYMAFFSEVKLNVNKKYGHAIPLDKKTKVIEHNNITIEGFQWGSKYMSVGLFLITGNESNLMLLRYNSKNMLN